ncbi:hypothetical protein BDV95DRAFT_273977 [Massariosphaeria phaeospora]|uniref:Uncharacterized protein n=1 Tax=Massariosphaeria phaeospora TaxID=100035 RepID=A0A7C8IFB6_9PLEO|nr:hypothetical protein BDV95DRAFT_273977 [Massariosphaeria phaeospora]
MAIGGREPTSTDEAGAQDKTGRSQPQGRRTREHPAGVAGRATGDVAQAKGLRGPVRPWEGSGFCSVGGPEARSLLATERERRAEAAWRAWSVDKAADGMCRYWLLFSRRLAPAQGGGGNEASPAPPCPSPWPMAWRVWGEGEGEGLTGGWGAAGGGVCSCIGAAPLRPGLAPDESCQRSSMPAGAVAVSMRAPSIGTLDLHPQRSPAKESSRAAQTLMAAPPTPASSGQTRRCG